MVQAMAGTVGHSKVVARVKAVVHLRDPVAVAVLHLVDGEDYHNSVDSIQ